jgi:hypothetical protein
MSQSKLKIRRKVEKRFTTDYAYRNRIALPPKDLVDKHVDDEMVLSWVFGLSSWFKDEVWDLVYDHGMRGVGGADKERFEALCERNNLPQASVACREKVKVRIYSVQSHGGAQADGDSRPKFTMRRERFGSTGECSSTTTSRWLPVESLAKWSTRQRSIRGYITLCRRD